MSEYHQQQQQGYPQQSYPQQEYVQQPQHGQAYAQPAQPATAYQSPGQMNEKAAMGGVSQQQHQHAHHKPSNSWSFSFWDCFRPVDVCCLAYWCPCYVFGKSYERNKTSEKNPSGFNGMCCAWFGLAICGFSPCFQCIMRGQTREKFGIDGSMGLDFLSACCCPCCIVVQEEKESVVRMSGIDPTTGAVYQPVPQMSA